MRLSVGWGLGQGGKKMITCRRFCRIISFLAIFVLLSANTVLANEKEQALGDTSEMAADGETLEGTDELEASADGGSSDDMGGTGYDVGEPNDYRDIATPVTLGETYEGEIGSYTKWKRDGLDVDFFAFSLKKDYKYRIMVSGFQEKLVKTTCLITLFTPSNDDAGVSYNMEEYGVNYYDYTAPETGTYFLQIHNYFDSTNKTEHYYYLKIADDGSQNPDLPDDPDDPVNPDVPSEDFDIGEPNDYREIATPITIGNSYEGEIGSYTKWKRDGVDVDFFSVYLNEGNTYRISVDGFQEELAKTTCIIRVYTPSNEDDSISYDMEEYGVNYSDYTAKETGTFYIKIYNYFDDDNKKDHYYSLRITDDSSNTPDDPENYDITEAEVILEKDRYTYNGKAKKPGLESVVLGNRDLEEGSDYTVSYSKNIYPGTAYVVLDGVNDYTGELWVPFTIQRAPVTFKNTGKTVKYSKVKSAGKTFSVIKTSGGGKVTATYYKKGKITKAKCRKYISVDKKGKVTVKKGAPRGTYKVKITVAAKGYYKKTSKTINIKVK